METLLPLTTDERRILSRTPDRIRTDDLRLRRPLLYPAELPGLARQITIVGAARRQLFHRAKKATTTGILILPLPVD